MVKVTYTSKASEVSAEISLPSNMIGELVWKGKTFTLHSGRQKFSLP